MVETKMWGERGLVATLSVDLGADSCDTGRWSRLLSAAFAGRDPALDWNSLEKVVAVVEPNFGSTHGFGSPDLVARLEFSDGPVAVLFAEAKCVTYAEASRDPAGRHLRGYNSRINGQIELNHRLAVALQHSRGLSSLDEPDWVDPRTCYVRGDKRRSVKRRGVLDNLVPLLNEPEGLTYLHVAITSDDQDPFAEGQPLVFLPVILDGDDEDVWDQEQHRFGWLGWDAIRRMADGWEPSLFRPSFQLNQHFLQRDPAPPPDPSAIPAPVTNWPLDRPGSGVSLVRIPSLDPSTALHFSWNRDNCAVRNYLRPELTPGTEPVPAYRPTSTILGQIVDEQRFGRARPRCEDAASWIELIRSRNREWGLPG